MVLNTDAFPCTKAFLSYSCLCLIVTWSRLPWPADLPNQFQGPLAKGLHLSQTHKAHYLWELGHRREIVPIKVISGAHDFKFFTGKRRNLKVFKVFLKYMYFMT